MGTFKFTQTDKCEALVEKLRNLKIIKSLSLPVNGGEEVVSNDCKYHESKWKNEYTRGIYTIRIGDTNQLFKWMKSIGTKFDIPKKFLINKPVPKTELLTFYIIEKGELKKSFLGMGKADVIPKYYEIVFTFQPYKEQHNYENSCFLPDDYEYDGVGTTEDHYKKKQTFIPNLFESSEQKNPLRIEGVLDDIEELVRIIFNDKSFSNSPSYYYNYERDKPITNYRFMYFLTKYYSLIGDTDCQIPINWHPIQADLPWFDKIHITKNFVE